MDPRPPKVPSGRSGAAAGGGRPRPPEPGGDTGAVTSGSRDAGTPIARAYAAQVANAGGDWCSHVAFLDAGGGVETVIVDDIDQLVHGYSVQKLAVATAVLAKVDRGELHLGRTVEVTRDDILGGSGIYVLQPVWGDRVTIANVLTAMLLVSDNTAVRLCGRLVPAREVNDILAANGFARTRVRPVADPHRFELGVTTPRETHDLLARLAARTLLAPASCDFLLRVLRALGGYHDGIRREMSSAERARVATKHGADFNARGAARHEVGIMFGPSGAPALTYAFFAEALDGRDNYGSTHPGVRAHAALGRTMLDAIG